MVAPSAALLLFAILFFGLMIDAGLFDPLIRKILKRVNGDPMKIAVGTALLSLTGGSRWRRHNDLHDYLRSDAAAV